MSEVPRLGVRRELLIDHFLIEEVDGVALRLQAPSPRDVVFQARPPGENACTGCYNLCADGDRVLLYYRGFYPIGEAAADQLDSQTTNLAESTDGLLFERPRLGLYEFQGATDNNIVHRGVAAHNFCVFVDGNPAATPETRFKAVGGCQQDALRAYGSADGVHWSPLQEDPLDVVGAFDSVNVPLWDPHAGCYRLFSRYFAEVDGQRIRAIQSCVSTDFIHWSRPVAHEYAAGVPLEHFYTNATVPCPGAEQILLSFPMRFVPQRECDTRGMDYPGRGLSDAIFMSSRDGVHWDRTFQQAWVRPGRDPRNWSHRSLTPAVGIIQTGADEWSVYLAEHYGWPDNRLRRYVVRPHGFAAAVGTRPRGHLLTRPLALESGCLRLNYATSAAGSVAVELRGRDNRPLPGFSFADMEPLYGDELDRAVRWTGGRMPANADTEPLRLCFALEDAELFSLRAAP